MINRKIEVTVQVERDAQNLFFVKMKYGFIDSFEKSKTVFGIEDEELFDNLKYLTYMTLEEFPCDTEIGSTIVIWEQESRYCYTGNLVYYKISDVIITGTTAMPHFKEINYLIKVLSSTIEKNNMGNFYVQYRNKIMNEDQFYEFQKQLSIYHE